MIRRLLLCLIIILSSCGDKPTNKSYANNSIIEINLLSESASNLTKLSEFASKIDYVPLQTTDYSLLSDFVIKFINVGDKIYIQNSGLKREILCFDTLGKFLFKFQNNGRGPEEYLNITDFDVGSDNTKLIILSDLDNKLLTYTYSDTGFIFSNAIKLKNPAPARAILIPETEKTLLSIAPWRGTESTLNLIINNIGDTIHWKPNYYKYKMVRKRNYLSSSEIIVYSVNKVICFKEEFSDTVFYVDSNDNKFKPRLIIDSHGTSYTPAMRGGTEEPRNNTSSIESIFETARYVFIGYSKLNNQKITDHIILYDKKTKKKSNLNIDVFTDMIAGIPRDNKKTKLIDDLNGGPDFNQDIRFWDSYTTDGKLYSLVDAIVLKKYIESEKFKSIQVNESKKTQLRKISDSLKETDNPVLVIVTPKN